MEEVYLQNTDRDEAHVQTVPPVAPAQYRHDRPARTTAEALIVSREQTVTCILSIRDKENGGTMSKKRTRGATLRSKVTSEIIYQASENDN